MQSADIGEIEIRHFIANDRSDLVQEDLAARGFTRAVYADEVVAEVEAAEARGVRVLFVPVEGPGGHVSGSDRVYRALRAFSERGGTVVTCFAGERVASSAPSLALAGDHVFMTPQARIYLHSANGPGAVVAESNRRMADLLYDRTNMPSGSPEAVLAVGGMTEDGAARAVEVGVAAAIDYGFADNVASEAGARLFAVAIASGVLVVPRRHELGGTLATLRALTAGVHRTLEIEPPVIRPWLASPAPASRSDVPAFAIGAVAIAAGALTTTNYAEDGNGHATAGAKLDHQGLALKVAPGNFQIGAYTFQNTLKSFTCTVSGTSTGVSFSISEPDTNYQLLACAHGAAGSPPGLAYVVQGLTGTTTICTLTTTAAPGAGNSVQFRVLLFRLPW